ncbi:class I SAM-dependent methyltransferase [Streptomyces sp. NPDC087440]|uniref:class I SAM-dependent methyltransferase n=1 Tax=Streptomyces sp. NPDC087440 TaxID=3365790 RepID=UPI0037F58DE8
MATSPHEPPPGAPANHEAPDSHPTHFAARAHSFNAAAPAYAAHRPSYPPALLDAVEEFAGRPLSGADVADIGAGTGIGTAVLHARGARVIAVEPGAGMAAEFRRTLPDVPLVRGNGNHLPLATASVDFLTYAQAWHWTDAALSAPEAMRVLRPGGALALWWNVLDDTVDWVAAQDARLRAFFADGKTPATGTMGAHGDMKNRVGHNSGGLRFVTREIPWTRRISIDDHLANLATHSAFLIQPEDQVTHFLTTERAELLKTFPDTHLSEPYTVELHLTLSPH